MWTETVSFCIEAGEKDFQGWAECQKSCNPIFWILEKNDIGIRGRSKAFWKSNKNSEKWKLLWSFIWYNSKRMLWCTESTRIWQIFWEIQNHLKESKWSIRCQIPLNSWRKICETVWLKFAENEEKSAVFVVEQKGTFFMLGWKHKKKWYTPEGRREWSTRYPSCLQ